MPASARVVDNMVTIARLHAALDSVIEIEELIAAIRAASTGPAPTVTQIGELLAETRERLRGLLTPPGRARTSND